MGRGEPEESKLALRAQALRDHVRAIPLRSISPETTQSIRQYGGLSFPTLLTDSDNAS